MTKEKIWQLFARKLTGEASSEELQELEYALRHDADLFHEQLLMQQVWELNPDQDSDYLEATYILHRQKMKKLGIEPGSPLGTDVDEAFHKPLRRNSKTKWVVSSVFIFALILSFIWVLKPVTKTPVPVATVPQEVKLKSAVTQNGVRKKLVLPDGTGVWLNAGSKLNYENVGKGATREVYLTGEAYFDVVKNPKRPFIIHTSAMDVRVLGTQFNVKAYPDDATVETSLIHGSVQVFLKNAPGKSYLLKPNQKLVLHKQKQDVAAPVDMRPNTVLSVPKISIKKLSYINGSSHASETAWTYNLLSFKDEPFSEVAQKLERWFDVQIEFKKEHLKEVRLTGSFENETLQQAVAALQFSTSFQYKIENKKLLIF
jgi:transmembrane sensor